MTQISVEFQACVAWICVVQDNTGEYITEPELGGAQECSKQYQAYYLEIRHLLF